MNDGRFEKRGETLESLGNYLRKQREARNITLEEVAKVTRIRKTMIEAIENDRHDLLPPRVFTQGFIRAYASYLGIDEEEVMKRYRELIESLEREEKERAGGDERVGKKLLTFTKGLLFIIPVVIVLVVWYWITSQNEKTSFIPEQDRYALKSSSAVTPGIVSELASQQGDEGGVRDEESRQDVPQEKAETRKVEGVKASEDETKPMSLRIVCREVTWIRLQLDGGEPYEVLMKPEESFTVTADEKFILRVGNAGGVELYLNEKPLGRPGKRGEVVDLVLPE